MGQLEQFLSDIAPNGDWQPLIDYINQNYISKGELQNKIELLNKEMNSMEFGDIKRLLVSQRIHALKEIMKGNKCDE